MKTYQYNNERLVAKVFEDVFTKYDLMNDLMSFGVHRLWKKNFIHWLNPQKNTKLIDVASGTGDIAKLYLDKIDYKGEVYCLDENKGMLELSKKKFSKKSNIRWFCGNAQKLKFKSDFFDYYTISFGIRNIKNINIALKEAYRVLKPGGRFLCLEFSKVQNETLNLLYKNYSKIIPIIGKLIINKSEPYEYLINSIDKFYNQTQLIRLIKKNKFENVAYRNLNNGIVAIHSGWKI